MRTRVRSVAIALIAAAALAGPAAHAEALLEPTAPEAVRASVLFMPEDRDGLDAPTPEGATRLTVTGAYSSGDRFAPEGFVIRAGDPTHPYPQGWDGLLLIDSGGRLSLHFVEEVAFQDRAWNLRDRGGRQAFVSKAERAGLTALQSHLLIREGALDLRPLPNARRFRRRLLFEMPDGRIGLWDTSPRAVSLYEAADELRQALAPRFALNLDMGTFDFCERQTAATAPERCGVLNRQGIDKLTNLLVLEIDGAP